LRQTLERHALAPELVEAWLAHQDALRDQVTQDAPTQCTDTRYTEASKAAEQSDREKA
jgi:hypothetical protein